MSATLPETVYLRSPDTFVSNSRAVLNGITYSMANVTSVRSFRVDPNALGPLLVLLFGLGTFLIAGVGNGQPEGWVVGPLLMAVGGWLLWRMEIEYVLILGTTGRERHTLVSGRRKDIQPVFDAITKAIVARG